MNLETACAQRDMMTAIIRSTIGFPGCREEVLIDIVADLCAELLNGEDEQRDALVRSAVADLRHGSASMRAATVIEQDGVRCEDCARKNDSVKLRSHGFFTCDDCHEEEK